MPVYRFIIMTGLITLCSVFLRISIGFSENLPDDDDFTDDDDDATDDDDFTDDDSAEDDVVDDDDSEEPNKIESGGCAY